MNEMTMPEVSNNIPTPPRRTNINIIIIIAIVIFLCCICLVIAGLFYYMGIKGEGPLAMLATDTPTRTPTPTKTATRTPTITPSPTEELSVVGEWVIHYDWDCDGGSSTGDITFYADYTYNVNDDSSLWGAWFFLEDDIHFIFDEYPNTHYQGTLSSSVDYMEGTMENLDDMSGCWYALR